MNITDMEFDEITNIPCRVLKTKSPEEIEHAVNVVIDYYYAHGFPFYPRDPEKMQKEFKALQEFDVSRLELPFNHLQQFMLGLNTVNSFHPEMWSAQCRNAKTPMDIFTDRALFATALRKRIKYSDTKLQPFNIRKSLKAFGVQSVSNFRPTIAKWVYDKFCPRSGTVLDPCAGYGGRMMGALASKQVRWYIGIDPSWQSFTGNQAMGRALGFSPAWDYELHQVPFEDFQLQGKPFVEWHVARGVDVVFTSPPYFNIEKYSTELTQSYLRYPTYPLWIDGFLEPLFVKGDCVLRKGGYFALNVNEKLLPDVLRIGNALYGEPTIYRMRLSKMLGQGDKDTVSHKTEPIVVWRKS